MGEPLNIFKILLRKENEDTILLDYFKTPFILNEVKTYFEEMSFEGEILVIEEFVSVKPMSSFFIPKIK